MVRAYAERKADKLQNWVSLMFGSVLITVSEEMTVRWSKEGLVDFSPPGIRLVHGQSTTRV